MLKNVNLQRDFTKIQSLITQQLSLLFIIIGITLLCFCNNLLLNYYFNMEFLLVNSGILLLLSFSFLKTKKFALINTSKPLGKVITIIFLMGACLIANEIYLVCLLNSNFGKATSIYEVIFGDILSLLIKLIFCIFSSIFFYIITDFLKEKKIESEFLLILYFAIIGLELLCVCNDLISSYLAIELVSLSSYLLASYKKESNYSIEAGIKYFIMGSISAAFFLLMGSLLIYVYSNTKSYWEPSAFYNMTDPKLYFRPQVCNCAASTHPKPPTIERFNEFFLYNSIENFNKFFLNNPGGTIIIDSKFIVHLPVNYDGSFPSSAPFYLNFCTFFNGGSYYYKGRYSYNTRIAAECCVLLEFIQKHAEPQSFREFIASLIESKVIFEKELLTTKNDLVNTQNKITLLLSEKNKILTSLNNWGTKYKYEMSQMSSHIKMLESMLSQDVKKFQEGHVSKLCVDLGQKCLEFWKLHIDETRELLFQEKAEINLKLEKIVQQLNLETDVFNKKQKHWEFLNKNKMDHPFFDNITIIKQVATFVQNQIELNKTINK